MEMTKKHTLTWRDFKSQVEAAMEIEYIDCNGYDEIRVKFKHFEDADGPVTEIQITN